MLLVPFPFSSIRRSNKIHRWNSKFSAQSRGDRDLVISWTRLSVPRVLRGPNVNRTVRNKHVAGTITAPYRPLTSVTETPQFFSLIQHAMHAKSANWNKAGKRTERSPLESSSNQIHRITSKIALEKRGAKGKWETTISKAKIKINNVRQWLTKSDNSTTKRNRAKADTNQRQNN